MEIGTATKYGMGMENGTAIGTGTVENGTGMVGNGYGRERERFGNERITVLIRNL